MRKHLCTLVKIYYFCSHSLSFSLYLTLSISRKVASGRLEHEHHMLQCRQKCVFTQIFFAQAEMLPVPANISENQLSETLLDSLSSSLGLTAADFKVNTGEVVENC